MSEEVKEKRYKRKRKKTFLSNAKHYGKQGYYGRGIKLDEETYQYFVQIMEVFNKGFSTDEEKELFVNNALEQTDAQEITCASNQFGCRVVETLLPFASDHRINKFLEVNGNDLRPLCSDRFASHVVAALLKESVKRSLGNSDQKDVYTTFVVKVSRFLLNNMEDYMWDTYGNHTMRAVFYSIADIPKEENKLHGKEVVIKKEEVEIPDNYKEIIKDYGERLLSWPQFNEFPSKDLTSGFLQVLLKALHKVDKDLLKIYLKKLINESFKSKVEQESDSDKLPPVFASMPNVMLLETALKLASPKYFSMIYKKCFKNLILKLAITKTTNMAVQKLFNLATKKEEFEEMYDELNDNFKQVLEAGHSGVILSLGQACNRLGTKQGTFVQNLMKALDCFEPQERQKKFIPCLCKLQTFNSLPSQIVDYEKEKLNLHGTLLLQEMLDFKKPIILVNCILNMDKFELKGILSNTMGSHITDSYVKSQYVGEKSRERLLRTLQGFYPDLATSKYGSRTFDNLWESANIKTRMSIMDELSHKEAAWVNSPFGKIIACKVNLNTYKKSKDEWKNTINQDKTSKSVKEEK